MKYILVLVVVLTGCATVNPTGDLIKPPVLEDSQSFIAQPEFLGLIAELRRSDVVGENIPATWMGPEAVKARQEYLKTPEGAYKTLLFEREMLRSLRSGMNYRTWAATHEADARSLEALSRVRAVEIDQMLRALDLYNRQVIAAAREANRTDIEKRRVFKQNKDRSPWWWPFW